MLFFLERLAGAGTGASQTDDACATRDAIAAQIQRIVSCRPTDSDAGSSLLDFGMPSVVDVARGGGESLDRYASRLARLIADHEPRLQHVSVAIQAESEPGSVSPYRLVVSGALVGDKDAAPLRLQLGH